jgi:hypothetical protein
MTDQPTFIEVGNSADPFTVVAQMREYADKQGGALAEAVRMVDAASHFGDISNEWQAIEWLFHHNAPKGYRFVTAPDDYPRFGYELATPDH